MPRFTQPTLVGVLGLLAFGVGLVGYTVFGWRFGASGNPTTFTLGVAAALLALVLTVRRRL